MAFAFLALAKRGFRLFKMMQRGLVIAAVHRLLTLLLVSLRRAYVLTGRTGFVDLLRNLAIFCLRVILVGFALSPHLPLEPSGIPGRPTAADSVRKQASSIR
jgi:hypothetical protein